MRIAEIKRLRLLDYAEEHGIPLRTWLLGRNELLGKLGSIAPSLANFALHNPLSRILADKFFGIATGAPLPSWSTTGTQGQWLKRSSAKRLE